MWEGGSEGFQEIHDEGDDGRRYGEGADDLVFDGFHFAMYSCAIGLTEIHRHFARIATWIAGLFSIFPHVSHLFVVSHLVDGLVDDVIQHEALGEAAGQDVCPSSLREI